MPDRTVVTLATATPGGGFPVFGQAFAETIHAADPSPDTPLENLSAFTG